MIEEYAQIEADFPPRTPVLRCKMLC